MASCQVHTPQSGLDTAGVGREVVAAILNRRDSQFLQWSAGQEQVSIRMGVLSPDKGPRETTARRRRRLAGVLEPALAERGWRSDAAAFRPEYQENSLRQILPTVLLTVCAAGIG